MSIAGDSFSLRKKPQALNNLSEPLSHTGIAPRHIDQPATSSPHGLSSPQPSGDEASRSVHPPPGQTDSPLSLSSTSPTRDPLRSRRAADEATCQELDSPTRKARIDFRRSARPNEVPPRSTVINGLEHRSMRSERPGIVVVHPHALFRDCFVRCLEASYEGHDIFDFSCISDWANDAERNTQAPTVIVLFMDGTKASSMADLQFVDSVADNVPIVVMSDIDDASYVMRTLKSGARGYIPTSLPFDVAVEAVRLVEAGGTFVPASSLEFTQNKQEATSRATELLTKRQMMVVGALCQGMANKRIAFELKMSEHTVKVHLRHIMRKLKARNRTEVAVLTKDYFQA